MIKLIVILIADEFEDYERNRRKNILKLMMDTLPLLAILLNMPILLQITQFLHTIMVPTHTDLLITSPHTFLHPIKPIPDTLSLHTPHRTNNHLRLFTGKPEIIIFILNLNQLLCTPLF